MITSLYRCVTANWIARPWRVNGVPSGFFTTWMENSCPPDGIAIDDRALLENNEGGTISINKENANLNEIRKLTENGRTCVELGMTINNSLSFVLTRNLIIKRIDYLTINSNDPSRDEMDAEELRDADTLISIHAIRNIFNTINQEMGGLAEREVDAA